ncbi:MAG: N-acetylmuramoyl-L-alanine amidase [Sphingomonadales bacterium]|nr:N-acetylmuramoyl-L-alanine amidase [Sphingomonadales bacterium]
MLPIKYLTIHCAATPEGRHVTHEQITAWDKAKFGQTSYHWVIELDGSMHQTLKDNQKGAHVGKRNTGNIGICYIGGVDKTNKVPKDTRTPAQIASLRTLVRTYQERYPGIEVKGHNEWPGVAKACPSFFCRMVAVTGDAGMIDLNTPDGRKGRRICCHIGRVRGNDNLCRCGRLYRAQGRWIVVLAGNGGARSNHAWIDRLYRSCS